MAIHFLETANVYQNRVFSIRLVVFFVAFQGRCFADIKWSLTSLALNHTSRGVRYTQTMLSLVQHPSLTQGIQ